MASADKKSTGTKLPTLAVKAMTSDLSSSIKAPATTYGGPHPSWDLYNNNRPTLPTSFGIKCALSNPIKISMWPVGWDNFCGET